jgi:sRNA-binding protein
MATEQQSYVERLKGLSDDQLMDELGNVSANTTYYTACQAEAMRRQFRGSAAALEAQRQAAMAEGEAARAALATADATKRNAKYMLWSVIFAAASAVITAVSVASNVFGRR